MAYKHEWKITGVDVWKQLQGHNDVVGLVYYALETTKEGFLEKLITNGVVSVYFNASKTIKPYNQLTELEMIQWVKDELKEFKKDANGDLVLDSSGKRIIDTDLVPSMLLENEKALEEMLNPTIVRKPLPW